MRGILLALILALPAYAQQGTVPPTAPPTYQSQLLRLAEILGSLHAIRSVCDPQADARWRERMMELIRLERPSNEQRNTLIGLFNSGFEATGARYKTCSDAARADAATLARAGETISRNLSAAIDKATHH